MSTLLLALAVLAARPAYNITHEWYSPRHRTGIEYKYNFAESKRKYAETLSLLSDTERLTMARPPSQGDVEILEARIRSLEEQLNSQNGVQVTQSTSGIDDTSIAMHFDYADEYADRYLVSAVTGLSGRLNVGDHGQLHYFGSQSNYHPSIEA